MGSIEKAIGGFKGNKTYARVGTAVGVLRARQQREQEERAVSEREEQRKRAAQLSGGMASRLTLVGQEPRDHVVARTGPPLQTEVPKQPDIKTSPFLPQGPPRFRENVREFSLPIVDAYDPAV